MNEQQLREEFQKFADSIIWSNDDGSEKYIGVGNVADWWIEKIAQTLAEDRERVRENLPKIITPTVMTLLKTEKRYGGKKTQK